MVALQRLPVNRAEQAALFAYLQEQFPLSTHMGYDVPMEPEAEF